MMKKNPRPRGGGTGGAQIWPNKEAKPVPQNYLKMLKWTIQCLK